MPGTDNLLKGAKKNVSLAKYTTFQIGGSAKYFYIARTRNELTKAVLAAGKLNLPFFILGGGSNLLVSDRGYNGVVINFQFSIFNFQNNTIIAGAGTPLGELVIASTEKGLAGLEWAAGIPGTLGGAIAGNAGAFNGSIADSVKEVEVLDSRNLKIKKLKKKNCQFGYRQSIFKKNKSLVILSAEFQFKKGDKRKIGNRIKELLDYRKERHPLNFPSAGSVFGNFILRSPQQNLARGNIRSALKAALKKFSGRDSVPAAYLIEECGLKGKRVGNVKVSEKHANFIVNLGGGKAKDVIRLIKLIKEKVKNKFGIELKEEIELLGF